MIPVIDICTTWQYYKVLWYSRISSQPVQLHSTKSLVMLSIWLLSNWLVVFNLWFWHRYHWPGPHQPYTCGSTDSSWAPVCSAGNHAVHDVNTSQSNVHSFEWTDYWKERKGTWKGVQATFFARNVYFGWEGLGCSFENRFYHCSAVPFGFEKGADCITSPYKGECIAIKTESSNQCHALWFFR